MHVDELRGILAGAMRKLDDAAAHFDKALSFYREGGYRPQLARLCYERVIRNESELNAVRHYIQHNPSRWARDVDNPANFPGPKPSHRP